MKNCEYCGKEFQPKRATARFDSPKCKAAFNRTKIELTETSTVDLDELAKIEIPPDVKVEHTPPKPDIRVIAKAKREALNPATGEIIPDEVMESHRQSAAKMNAIFEAKGLPLIHLGPKQDHFIDTGIDELNSFTKEYDVLGIGGIPRQKITEIFGSKGSGKSSLVKSIVKDPTLKILYIDVEGGLTSPPENVQVIKASLVEEVEDIIIPSLDEIAYDLIIVDSIAPLVTRKRFEQDLEGMGAKAKAMSLLVNNTTAHLRPMRNGVHVDEPGTAVVFINQLRDTMNSFGKREFTPGGRALEYMASFRLEFRSAKADIIKKRIDGKDMILGQYIRVKVEKTRYGIKDQEIKYPLMYQTLRDFDEYYKERLKEILG